MFFRYFCAQYHTNIQHYETEIYHCTCFGSVRAAAEPRLGTVQLALFHPGRDYRDRGAWKCPRCKQPKEKFNKA